MMRGWAMVLVMVAAYALSFLDRQVLALLVDAVRRDLSIGDFQMGLLLGPAFGVFYALLGMPCGWLADRVRRTWLIFFGLLSWSGATVMSGLAHSFVGLATARMGVGIGEATLVPAAVSLIADSFPPERRIFPLAVFTAGISIGAGLALVLGGELVAIASKSKAVLDGLAPWRIVLLMAGGAGVPLALLVAFIHEPARPQGERHGHALGDVGLGSALVQKGRIFAPLLAATSLLYIYANALSSWLPSLLVRRFGLAPPVVGRQIGYIVLASALSGTIVGGLLSTALAQRGREDSSLIVMVTGAFILVPAGVLAPLGSSAELTEAAMAIVYFALALCFGVATASIVSVTPTSIRARMIALYLLLGNLAGLGLGPPATGFLLERVLHNSASVNRALALIAIPTLFPGAVLLGIARREAQRRIP